MAATVTGFKGVVNEANEARRFAALAPPVVASATDLRLTSSGTRTIVVAAGTAMACGVRWSETASTNVVLPANTSGQPRYDLIGLRFTWGASPSVTVFSRQGTPSSSPTSPAPVRNPGVSYEMTLGVVYVRASVGVIQAADIYDERVWGGVGGPYVATQATWMNRMDLPIGARILVGTSLYEVVDRNTASSLITTAVLDPQVTAWKSYVPQLRNTNSTLITATTFWKDGRYRIQDGTCRLKVRLGLYGTVNDWTNFDGVPYSIDLPVRAGNQLTDQWLDATIVYPGGPTMAGKLLVRSGATRGLIYVVAAPDDVRVRVMNGRPEQVHVDGSYLV